MGLLDGAAAVCFYADLADAGAREQQEAWHWRWSACVPLLEEPLPYEAAWRSAHRPWSR